MKWRNAFFDAQKRYDLNPQSEHLDLVKVTV